ncbi:MAG: hypothetical protein R3258_08755 [Acidimicrobiia bacterium]|nr:hypothetical protein [Acidimicrobiia bacterium]
MGRYAGSLRTHEEDLALSASLELENGRVKINIGETPIGDWPVQEVEFEKTDSGYRIAAEGDQVLLDLEPKDAVALGIQLSDLNSGKKSRRSKAKSSPKPRRGTKSDEASSPDEKQSRSRFRRSKSPDNAAPEVPAPVEPLPSRNEPLPAPSQQVEAEPEPASNEDEIARILARMAEAEPEPAAPTPAPPTSPEPVAEVDVEPKKSKRKERAKRPKRDKREKAPKTRTSLGTLVKTKTPAYLDRVLDAVEPKLKPYLPAWVFNRLTVLVVLFGLLLIPIFPGFMATVLLVLGGITVMFGAVVYTDSVLSSRFLYGRTTPNHVLVVGVSTVVVGIILTLIAT